MVPGGSGRQAFDPRLIERLQRDTPGRRWVLETYEAARTQPERATGVLRAASKQARKLRSRERRALWDVVYDLIRYGAAYEALGHEPLDGWLAEVDLSVLPFAVRAGCTPEAAADLLLTYGEAREDWLVASNQRPRAHLRTNLLRNTRDQLQKRLAHEGIVTEAIGEVGLAVEGRANLLGSQAYRDGRFELQDLASQRVAALVPGERVLDFCAGAGGKTLALAALGKRVHAWDVRSRALEELKKRAGRAGARVSVGRPEGRFPTVFVDAPCSGSGVWRRHPEYRWRLGEHGGLDVLREAAGFVEPGGTLVYATCSALRAENEAVVDAFVGEADWVVVESLRTAPHLDDTDGMYAAVLVRG